jgi:hypothetical protein
VVFNPPPLLSLRRCYVFVTALSIEASAGPRVTELVVGTSTREVPTDEIAELVRRAA